MKRLSLNAFELNSSNEVNMKYPATGMSVSVNRQTKKRTAP